MYALTEICTSKEYVLTRSVYQTGVCTNWECVLTRSVYYPGVCTNRECVPTGSVYYPGVCIIRECVPTGNVYQPGMCTNRECVPTGNVYQPGVCTSQVLLCIIPMICFLKGELLIAGMCLSAGKEPQCSWLSRKMAKEECRDSIAAAKKCRKQCRC